MTKADLMARIDLFNQGRPPNLLAFKYRNMQASSFVFYRGTCHLFYQDWLATSPLNEAPATWICGDLHLENMGSYKAANRLIYFDINDFDEAALAPCSWDLARFITSILLATPTLGMARPESLELCRNVLATYRTTLARGKAHFIEREMAAGLVRDLLESVRDRSTQSFLNSRTVFGKTGRKLWLDPKRTLAATEEERHQVTTTMQKWAATQPNPKYYKVLDIAHRIAGTGSLGIERYVLLVEGKNSNWLLDLKAQPGSVLQPYLQIPQPNWANQAQRVVTLQERMQANSPAVLHALEINGKAFVLKDLQPTQDRINLVLCNGRGRRLAKLLDTMAKVIGWNQIRSSGRQGSATTDQLIAFGEATDWPEQLLDYAQSYAAQVETDYKIFCAALKPKTGNLQP